MPRIALAHLGPGEAFSIRTLRKLCWSSSANDHRLCMSEMCTMQIGKILTRQNEIPKYDIFRSPKTMNAGEVRRII